MGKLQSLAQSAARIFLLLYGLALTIVLLVPPSTDALWQQIFSLGELQSNTSPMQPALTWLFHVAVFIPVGVATPVAVGRTRPRCRIFTALITLTISAIIELLRVWIPGLNPAPSMVAAHVLGVCTGFLVLSSIDRVRLPKSER